MKNIIKTCIKRTLLLVLLTICLCSFSCPSNILAPYVCEINGIRYIRSKGNNSYYSACGIADEAKNEPILYILDKVDGISVISFTYPAYPYQGLTHFCGDALERLYTPWCIGTETLNSEFYVDTQQEQAYVISACLRFYVFLTYQESEANYCLVIPRVSFEQNQRKWNQRTIPANIAYMFNHAGNPNGGYFFVDLIEESGKIIKPPYAPRREGYNFLGWYKDEACTQPVTAADGVFDRTTGSFKPNANVINTDTATFYALFETFTVSIERTNGEPGKTYMYDVVCTPADGSAPFTMQVSVTCDANGYGKTDILEAPEGTYTATELNTWSWRHTETNAETGQILPDPTKSDTLTEAKKQITLPFNSGMKIAQWLDGFSNPNKNVHGTAE